ncbi:putative 4-hydroxy-4-methyl-2-oxoglutarate aldolase [Gynuella sp.]|uniref:putative 4-hydroxy-4-methyl-2-oxoglutarate aldolase n=1 Tax=Gynuella sp. TaxID=2969146 RepID=UPI003D096421
MNISTPDLCDEFEESLSILSPGFKDFGGIHQFYGQAVTINCLNDNSKIKAMSVTSGHGKVMVVDGQASMDYALLGDMIGDDLVKNGWSGIIINGCIRDVEALRTLQLGIKALNSIPRRSLKRDQGEVNVTLQFSGATIDPEDWVYADESGIVVSKHKLI